MTIITTPPLILDSAGQPAEGFLAGKQTSRFITDAGLITDVPFRAQIKEGQVQSLDGTPLNLPATPTGQAVELWEIFIEPPKDGNGKRSVTRPARYVTIPDASSVAYADLIEVEAPPSSGEWVVPPYVQTIVDGIAGVDAAATQVAQDRAAVEDAKTAVLAVPATSAGIMAAVAADPDNEFSQLQSATYVAKDGDGKVPTALVPDTIARTSSLTGKLDKTEAASLYATPRKNKAVLFGNSIEYYNFGDAVQQSLRPYPSSRGYVAQGNSMLGHRLDWINRGVGGEDTGGFLARLQTDLINVDAGYAVIGGPTNDVSNIDGGFRTVAQTKAAYNTIWDACIASGKFIVQVTAPPRDAATANQKALRSDLNNWLRAQQGVRKNFVIVDIERATMDPATNAFVAGYSWDGVHLATPGAVAAGAEFARKLESIVPPRTVTLPAADPRNLLKNTGGAFLGTATAAPTGWTVAGSTGTDPTYDRVAFGDRPGQKLKVIMPTGSVRILRSTTLQQALSEFAPGDVVRFSVAYEATALDAAPAANTQALYATLERNGANVALDLEWSADANPNSQPGTQNENMGGQSRAGILRTTTYTVPAGSTQTLAATIQIRGGGTYHFWNPTIEKLV